MSDKDTEARLALAAKIFVDENGNCLLDENDLTVLKNLNESYANLCSAFEHDEETIAGLDKYPAHTRQLADIIEEFMLDRGFKAKHYATVELLAWTSHRVLMNLWRTHGAATFTSFKEEYLNLVKEALDLAEKHIKETGKINE